MTLKKTAASQNVAGGAKNFGDVQKSRAHKIASEVILKFYRISYKIGKLAFCAAGAAGSATRSAGRLLLSEGAAGILSFLRKCSEFKRSRRGRGELSLAKAASAAALGAAGVLRQTARTIVSEGPVEGFRFFGRLIRRKVSSFWAKNRRMFNYAAPLAGMAVFAVTVYFWSNMSFALSVTYNNQQVGLIKNEQEFRNVAYQMETNVSTAAGRNFTLTQEPQFRLVLVKNSELSTKDDLYDNLVLASSENVVKGYGLYVDKRLIGASEDGAAMQTMLDSILAPYKENPKVQKVEFAQDVEIINGVYPATVVKPVENMLRLMTSSVEGQKAYTVKKGDSPLKVAAMFHLSVNQLYVMNPALTSDQMVQGQTVMVKNARPFLTVRLIVNEAFNEKIPCPVQTVETDSLYQGQTQVKQNGADGIRRIVAAVAYEGKSVAGKIVLSSSVLQQPVEQIVYVGTKKRPQGSGGDDSGGAQALSASGSREAGGIVAYAEQFMGTRYVMGGAAPGGFDCSGFTKYVYSKYGVSLAHSALIQSYQGSSVGRSGLQAGDLVFFDTNGGGGSINHVGIYVGGGRFVQACSRNPNAITVSSLNERYYQRTYVTARRILN
ncbi:MAG TPA: NlpC/P60 family protein [Clostridia bacterium]|nr:NlpC/P60 family protein [Clostridia bacterium]